MGEGLLSVDAEKRAARVARQPVLPRLAGLCELPLQKLPGDVWRRGPSKDIPGRRAVERRALGGKRQEALSVRPVWVAAESG